MDLKKHIRGIPDFPIPGILFYDISTLLSNPEAWSHALDLMQQKISKWKPDLLGGIESRGFLIASALADRMGIPMFMIRKKGKLPGEVISHSYELEYGTDTVEIQHDAISTENRIVILDDLLATGGTLAASIDLCRLAGGEVVGAGLLIELDFLNGKEKLGIPHISLMSYSE